MHKWFRRRPGRILNVLCTLNLRPVSTGERSLTFFLDDYALLNRSIVFTTLSQIGGVYYYVKTVQNI